MNVPPLALHAAVSFATRGGSPFFWYMSHPLPWPRALRIVRVEWSRGAWAADACRRTRDLRRGQVTVAAQGARVERELEDRGRRCIRARGVWAVEGHGDYSEYSMGRDKARRKRTKEADNEIVVALTQVICGGSYVIHPSTQTNLSITTPRWHRQLRITGVTSSALTPTMSSYLSFTRFVDYFKRNWVTQLTNTVNRAVLEPRSVM